MRLSIIAIGTRMPDWINAGCKEYFKRLPGNIKIALHEIAAAKRKKGADNKRLLTAEGARMLDAIEPGSHVVALTRIGRRVSSQDFRQRLQQCYDENTHLIFLIGGPDGLSKECLGRAKEQWALSAMTMAHPIVRLVMAEQIYRSWSLMAGLPYHRGG